MDPFVQDYFVALFGVSKYILGFVMLETEDGEKGVWSWIFNQKTMKQCVICRHDDGTP